MTWKELIHHKTTNQLVSDVEALVLEFWGVLGTPSLSLFQDLPWPGVLPSVRVSSMDQIDLFKSHWIRPCGKKPLKKQVQKCKYEWTLLPNLLASNNPGWVKMPLKSISQSIKKWCAKCVELRNEYVSIMALDHNFFWLHRNWTCIRSDPSLLLPRKLWDLTSRPHKRPLKRRMVMEPGYFWHHQLLFVIKRIPL